MKCVIKFLIPLAILLTYSCETSDEEYEDVPDPKEKYDGKGVGPIGKIETGPINDSLAQRGKSIFSEACTNCHIYGRKHVGPELKGVTDRRTPEWIMNMILNPEEMTKKDPMASQLKEKHHQQMNPDGKIDSTDARALLEYLRWKDAGN